MRSDRLLPCRVLLVWALVAALILPVPLGGCVARKQDGAGEASGLTTGRGGPAARPGVAAPAAVGPEEADRAGEAGREAPRGLDAALLNVVASFMGLPGLAPSSGARDEGLGYHQDGTARRAGSADAFDGRQAQAYMGAGLMGANGGLAGPPDDILRARPGEEFSGRRRDNNGFRTLDNLNPFDMALERGLNYGMGMLNSAGEAVLSGLADNGRARLNFQLDRDGRFSGEGDVLLPFWDAPRHTLFTQIGARSMDVSGGEEDGSQRWIGNFGLGHRWFPLASSMEDAGNLMLGWNIFFDNDFSRSHQRGGAGVEAQYDWFHLAANYYAPLSDWKDSRDFDGNFIEERPARGWDARAKAYLPFYRNVALTGAFSQWYGDHVAMYGSVDDLEKDPRVWSYGVEYTPIPLLSAFARQRSTERGKTDTEFGLQFTWHFGMPWEEQTSHAKVAELRTVSGSRHEFVDRENRIILEYRAKNSGRIEYLGPVPGRANAFAFRVTDGFGGPWAGKTVHVSADGVTLAAAPSPARSLFALAGELLGGLLGVREAHAAVASHSYVTDRQGRFIVSIASPVAGPLTLHMRAGENEQTITLNAATASPLSLTASGGGKDTPFGSDNYQTITLTATLTIDGQEVQLGDGDVTWSVASSTVSCAAWRRGASACNGLTWGQTPLSLTFDADAENDMAAPADNAPDGKTAYLTDIVGERTVTVRATVTYNGQPYTAETTVTFGKGPLAVFATPLRNMTWTDAVVACGGSYESDNYEYQPATNLPSKEELLAVSAPSASNPGANARGAAFAAKWPNDGSGRDMVMYWTGKLAEKVDLGLGDDDVLDLFNEDPVAVCRR
ncbi:MAG TPA: inverse autotransporter beta domain-containing protein [Candidatus Desulfovibrio intestinavium]|uniref:Inverse autotransporter beta domain-containing protein n=1 Tax=Candidatus Desulfovibrio intestinavium TaxID=2838534 RepID=A0A9D2KQK6_9BACT|nr:inverse autotransporter beta domain-containing protein [Candidatus Desulfovibrio intestinavium]